jgi:hypothetical protein
MDTITLSDGSKQHTIDGWIGIQLPNTPMTKTKWRRTDLEYFNINGYTQIRNSIGSINCNCKGYYFRKNCRHIKEVKLINE